MKLIIEDLRVTDIIFIQNTLNTRTYYQPNNYYSQKQYIYPHPLAQMFSSLKLKLQSLLHNPFQRRSVSICIESKGKKPPTKRDISQTKSNLPLPQETPRKIRTGPGQVELEGELDQLHCYGPRLDYVETVGKEYMWGNSTTQVLENRCNNQKWLDFVSDVDSSEKLLLTNSQEDAQDQSKKSTYAPQSTSKNKPSEPCLTKEPDNSFCTPKKWTDSGPQPPNNQNNSSKSFINWLQQDHNPNNPDTKVIKEQKQTQPTQPNPQQRLSTQSREDLRNQLKRNNLRDYRNRLKDQAKGVKYWTNCIVCEQTISPKPPSSFITLTCSHRLHRVCGQIIRWKPKMKCTICEMRDVKDLVYYYPKTRAIADRTHPARLRREVGIGAKGTQAIHVAKGVVQVRKRTQPGKGSG